VAATNKERMATFLSAAMLLPGTPSQAQDAGVRADRFLVSYNHIIYKESGNRMKVDADQLALTAPIADRFEIRVNAIKDVMSGASPEYYIQNANGEPVQVLQSGASIRDQRDAINVSGGFYGNGQYVEAGFGQSKEDDYDAGFYNIQYRRDLNDKNTSILFNLSTTSDDVWRADIPGFNVAHRDKTDLMFGVNQILDRNSTLQLALTQSESSGNLSDPYKRAYIADQAGALPESRPGDRSQTIITGRYSRYLEGTDSALHTDVRIAFDSWGANSSTVEVKWNKKLADEWLISPSIRYYQQSSANFYDLAYLTVPADGYFSTDYRLAGFGAVSAKVGVRKSFSNDASVMLKYEYYDRRYRYVLDSGSKGHGVDDYNFSMLSITFDFFY
jgi:hypothetical protein